MGKGLRCKKEDLEKQIQQARILLGLADEIQKKVNKATGVQAPQINAVQATFGAAPTIGNQAVNVPLADAFKSNEFDVATEAILKQDSAVRGLERSLNNLAQGFGMTADKSAEFADSLAQSFTDIKNSAFQSLGQGLSAVAETFGNSLGLMISGMASFEDVVANSLKALGQAILVELPKIVGVGLVQAAFSPANIAAFPASLPVMLPLLLGGLALIGASGLIGGALSGLGGGGGDSIQQQAQQATQIGGTGQTPQQTAAGLGSNSAVNTQSVTNVTVVLNTNGILTALEKQQYINGLLTGG